MGSTFTKVVDFKMAARRSRKHRHLKSKWFLRKRTLSAPTLLTDSWSTESQSFQRRTSHDDEEPKNHDDHFTEIEAQLTKFPVDDENFKMKLRTFVTAWRTGLSYPHERMGTSSTGIPLAATSYCKEGISRWKRYGQQCLRCSSPTTTEQLLEDLVHKESLERLLKDSEITEVVAASVLIKHDLWRLRLYESVSSSDANLNLDNDQQQQLARFENEPVPSEDDLIVTYQVNLPPPIHIEPPLEVVHPVLPNEALVQHLWEYAIKKISEMSLNKDKDHQPEGSAVEHIIEKLRLRHNSSSTSPSIR